MQKIIALGSIFTATLLSACSQANNNQVFGHNVSNGVVTIAQAKSLADDSNVTVEGNILRQVDGDEYILKDATGEIKVEIDDRVWNGLSVTPQDKIRVFGELDRDTFHSDIDARSVEKVQ